MLEFKKISDDRYDIMGNCLCYGRMEFIAHKQQWTLLTPWRCFWELGMLEQVTAWIKQHNP